jgi:hypothetical protein
LNGGSFFHFIIHRLNYKGYPTVKFAHQPPENFSRLCTNHRKISGGYAKTTSKFAHQPAQNLHYPSAKFVHLPAQNLCTYQRKICAPTSAKFVHLPAQNLCTYQRKISGGYAKTSAKFAHTYIIYIRREKKEEEERWKDKITPTGYIYPS